MKLKFTSILMLLCALVFAQTPTPGVTIGLLYSDDCKVSEGYTLYSASFSEKAYLIDNCGQVVNEWTFNDNTTFPSAYLLPDGSCAKLIKPPGSSPAPYGEACLEVRDWNNNLTFNYCPNGRYSPLHSDFAYLPNGNFLIISQDLHNATEAISNGRNPITVGNTFHTESVIEVQPMGVDTGLIVWEWNLWDHLIQDFNVNLPNYDLITNQPGKMDINALSTLTHYNSIWYLEDRDHIFLSSWKEDEIFIIDHNTTTAEAAGTAGDFIYRWGNPALYGVFEPKLLDGMHNPRLVPNNYPYHAGKFSVHNNRHNDMFGSNSKGSAAIIFDDVWDPVLGIYPKDPATNAWLPKNYSYIWYGEVFPGDSYYSIYESGVQVQPNGNITMTEAIGGRIVEIDPLGEVVWVYKTPDVNGSLIDQGVNSNIGDIYKAEKYAPDYSGILSTTTSGIVENENSVTDACLAQENIDLAIEFDVLSNQSNNIFTCGSSYTPKVKVYNVGSAFILNTIVALRVNGGTPVYEQWEGILSPCEFETIEFPAITGTGIFDASVEIFSVNNFVGDDDNSNNSFTKRISMGEFFDSDTLGVNYSNNELSFYTICPENTYLESVELEFTFVDIEVNVANGGTENGCWDYLTIYNGNNINAPQLVETLCSEVSVSGQLPSVASSNLEIGDKFISTSDDGCLTVEFFSDGGVPSEGWRANINCFPNICPLSLNIENIINSATYHTQNFISSNGKVNELSNGDVEFLTGNNYIEFTNGFEVTQDFSFEAKIQVCN